MYGGQMQERIIAAQEQLLSVSTFLEGVVTGVTIALILGIVDHVKARRARREQIQHIKSIVINAYPQIHIDEHITLPSGETVNANAIKFIFFEGILRDVNSAISYRANRLDYSEIYDIRSILVDISDMMVKLDIGNQPGRKLPDGVQFYDQHFFDRLKSLKWLDLHELK